MRRAVVVVALLALGGCDGKRCERLCVETKHSSSSDCFYAEDWWAGDCGQTVRFKETGNELTVTVEVKGDKSCLDTLLASPGKRTTVLREVTSYTCKE